MKVFMALCFFIMVLVVINVLIYIYISKEHIPSIAFLNGWIGNILYKEIFN